MDKLVYELYERGEYAASNRIEELWQAVVDCSSYVPWDSIVGQKIRRLLPDANWDPKTLIRADEGQP